MSLELFLFLTLGILAVVSAAAMIISKNAIYSALFLIVNFGTVALLFLMLDAPFISMVQIAVYAGAIMVLFLFVIMLLGAEQTTDTSRRFRWLAGVATALAAGFLSALSIPLVLSGGLNLPEPPGEAPQVRLVHAARTTAPIEVRLIGGTEQDMPEQGLLLERELTFGTTTEFQEVAVEPGDYILQAFYTGQEQPASGGQGNVLLSTRVTLANDEVQTFVITGEMEIVQEDGAERFTVLSPFEVTSLPNSFADSGSDSARILVANFYTQDDVLLVDYGTDGELSVRTETVTDDEGNERDELIITDTVVASGLGYGEVSEPVSFPEGTYNLQMVAEVAPGEFEVVVPLDDWQVTSGTEQNILLVPDYDAVQGEEGFRPRVLDRTQDEITFRTAESFGSPGDIGQQLFTRYLLPVNMVGFLLLVGLVGVIVLTRPQGPSTESRATRNRRRKVSRPLVSVISQQTGGEVTVEPPKLQEPGSGD